MPLATCRDVETAWYEAGRGEPLVLVHGLADDHRAWRKVLPALMLRRRVILYDFRGHGGTSLGTPDGTLAQLSGDLVALLDHLELEQADLCGFSLGGTIVMRTAIDHPERVGRLLPVATSSRVGRAASDWYAERAALVERGAPELAAALEKDTLDVYANAPAEFADGWMIRRQSTADPRGFGNACAAMAALKEQPLDPDLGRIAAPTLVIAADRDQHCPPRAGEIIAAGIPGARMALVEGSGHPIPVEQPEVLAGLILGFLEGGKTG